MPRSPVTSCWQCKLLCDVGKLEYRTKRLNELLRQPFDSLLKEVERNSFSLDENDQASDANNNENNVNLITTSFDNLEEDQLDCPTQLAMALTLREKYMIISSQKPTKLFSRLFDETEGTKSSSSKQSSKKSTTKDDDSDSDFDDRPAVAKVAAKTASHLPTERIIKELLRDPGRPSNLRPMLNKLSASSDSDHSSPLHKFGQLPRISFSEFVNDLNMIDAISKSGPQRSHCHDRMRFLLSKWRLYRLTKDRQELNEQLASGHRDFYNCHKIDTHIHAASAMNQKHLLNFIKKKLRTESHTPVLADPTTGEQRTLGQLFQELNLSPHLLNIDMLNVRAGAGTFNRFDRFNQKYSPFGMNELRSVFLKTNNFIEGRYFAELLHEVIDSLKTSKYVHAELRLSIYGQSRDEWDKLARWAITHGMLRRHIRWIIQIPRLYSSHRQHNIVPNFQALLNNIFQPLLEVSLNSGSHRELDEFLPHVCGLDSVDDESVPENSKLSEHLPPPEKWNSKENPPYTYYLYHMYANLVNVNYIRRQSGQSVLTLRPHCGEAGSHSHPSAAFLLAQNINHGVIIDRSPVQLYLYYLAQIGLSMSPLSNNTLFVEYPRNPLPKYLKIGLNVTLSTDDPLMLHFTREPLMEEYSVAAQVWRFTFADMCELAKNSVLISDFPHEAKMHWLGERYDEETEDCLDYACCHVPLSRINYRHHTLTTEMLYIIKKVKLSHY